LVQLEGKKTHLNTPFHLNLKKTFRSRGYDATTHFESTVDDVLEMYTRITGKVIDLDAVDPDKAAGDDE